MTLILAGDIGGTKTLLRLVEISAGEPGQMTSEMKNLYEGFYSSREFPDLVPLVERFFGEAAAVLGTNRAPAKACLAIAGPVLNNTSHLTNLDWYLTRERLEQELNIPRVQLINDFEAVGYGVLGLSAGEIYTLQSGHHEPGAPIAVIGAGTGLGEAFLILRHNVKRQVDEYVVFPSEGGHVDFAPRNDDEWLVWQYLRRSGLEHISVERVVSGMGIVPIYESLRSQDASYSMPPKTEAAEISAAALDGADALCDRAMQIFVEAYGAEAGNMALKLLPYGGLYLAGGIGPKILPLIEKENRFMKAFRDKGRVSGLLERVPVHLVLNDQVGLLGAAVYTLRL
ncbi:MAG TPA: glucokinase [Oscillatoriaceae cyanobacterium M33_DOE_052]|uniref:Glucokinase n=1 Tax=Planktothricoides sp. SpSt-374 TaxID=2282167 RepID=A0A7C3ZYI6_9CYAN|nr:glucokinase [Oscillatoriaceae cyanobacterium M33_DOE_052]